MKTMLFIFALSFSLSTSAFADLFLICNSQLDINKSEFREAYLGQKLFLSGETLAPFDNESLVKQFSEQVLKITPERYETLWVKLGFQQGLSSPKAKETDEQVCSFVSKTRGALGYVATPCKSAKTIEQVGK